MTALPKLGDIWVYLAASPARTYDHADRLSDRADHLRDGALQSTREPVLISVALLVVVLLESGTPYATYFEGAQFVHFLLGPATVALAIPLYRQWPKLRRAALPLIGGLVSDH